MRRGMRPALLLALVVTGPAVAEDAGLALYMTGKGAVALLAGGAVRDSGGRFPCANCHGADGAGGREGATDVPAVTWSALTRPTATRPAYDAALLARALRDGIAPDGRALAGVMPRYEMPVETVDSLIRTLGQLEAMDHIGISPAEISVVVAADDPRAAGFAEALQAFSASGGAWGRQVRVVEEKDAAAVDLDEIAATVADRAATASEDMLFDRLMADGHRSLQWLTALPPDERDFRLMQRGLVHDPASRVVVWTDAGASAPRADRADIVYTDLASAARGLKPLVDAGVPLRLVAPASLVLDAALRDPDPLAYLDGYAAGEALGRAMLAAGRPAGQARIRDALAQVPLGDLLTLQALGG